MVNLIVFVRKHLGIGERQIMLPCARICFLSAPFYGSSHTDIGSKLTFFLAVPRLLPHASAESAPRLAA